MAGVSASMNFSKAENQNNFKTNPTHVKSPSGVAIMRPPPLRSKSPKRIKDSKDEEGKDATQDVYDIKKFIHISLFH